MTTPLIIVSSVVIAAFLCHKWENYIIKKQQKEQK